MHGKALCDQIRLRRGSFTFAIDDPFLERSFQALCLEIAPEVDAAADLYRALWIDGPTLLVVVTPDRNQIAKMQLKRRFGLTEAETGVLIGLGDGKRIRALAQERGVSEHTVRNQVKSVFAKTGLQSQIELVKLVADLKQ